MRKTVKTAAVRAPRNYWISRRVYADGSGKEYIKLNGNYVEIEWLVLHGWDVDIAW